MKVGIEVEGRFKGLRTVFCSVPELTHDNIEKIRELPGIAQVYISDHNNEIDLTLSSYTQNSDLVKFLIDYYLVTIERTEVGTVDIHDGIELMLNIPISSFWNMRRSDQIKFSENLMVYATTIENMVVTFPQDFEGDLEL